MYAERTLREERLGSIEDHGGEMAKHKNNERNERMSRRERRTLGRKTAQWYARKGEAETFPDK